MNEAAFSNCNAEDYINKQKMCKQNQTQCISMHLFRILEKVKKKEEEDEEEEEEEENNIVLEEKKCRVKTYQDAVKSLKELQEFAIQHNDSDMLGVISQAKVFVKVRQPRE